MGSLDQLSDLSRKLRLQIGIKYRSENYGAERKTPPLHRSGGKYAFSRARNFTFP